MAFLFKKLQKDTHRFLEILPDDWQDVLKPFWSDYQNTAVIYVIMQSDEIIGGGLVFSKPPADISYYNAESLQWFENGYQYLGYIWINEEHRNQNLGSFWLEELKKTNPRQKYWLLVEDEHLHRFYERNGFVLNRTICNQNQPEWLYAYSPVISGTDSKTASSLKVEE